MDNSLYTLHFPNETSPLFTNTLYFGGKAVDNFVFLWISGCFLPEKRIKTLAILDEKTRTRPFGPYLTQTVKKLLTSSPFFVQKPV